MPSNETERVVSLRAAIYRAWQSVASITDIISADLGILEVAQRTLTTAYY